MLTGGRSPVLAPSLGATTNRNWRRSSRAPRQEGAAVRLADKTLQELDVGNFRGCPRGHQLAQLLHRGSQRKSRHEMALARFT